MKFVHNIWFDVSMAVAMLLILVFSVFMHRRNYKHEHLASSSSYIMSLLSMLIVCVPILVAWTWSSTPTTIWEYILRIEPKIRTFFPMLFALMVTIIGMFSTFALLQPRLKIANTVAFIPKTNRLVFNVKNNGLFKVLNLKPELYICTFQKNKVIEHVQLDLQSISSLDWRFAHADLCCIDLATSPDESDRLNSFLNEMNDCHCMELRVSSTHIISGKCTTEVKTFYKNDILKGRFRKDTLYAIDDNNQEIKKLHIAQDYFNIIHAFFAHAEAIVAVLLFLILGWMVGGKYPQYQDCYMFCARLLSLCLFLTTVGKFGTNIPIESSWNSDWSYLKHIKPLTRKEESLNNDKPNTLDIIVTILQTLNNKYKQLKSLLS